MSKGTLQPNSKMCFFCGVENPVGLKLRVYEVKPGVVETTFTAPEHYQSYPGMLQAGSSRPLLMRSAGGLDGAGGQPALYVHGQAGGQVSQECASGQPLRVVGKAGLDPRTGAEAWAGIYDAESGELLAEGNTVLVNVPEEMLKTAGNLDGMGWKVYPE